MTSSDNSIGLTFTDLSCLTKQILVFFASSVVIIEISTNIDNCSVKVSENFRCENTERVKLLPFYSDGNQVEHKWPDHQPPLNQNFHIDRQADSFLLRPPHNTLLSTQSGPPFTADWSVLAPSIYLEGGNGCVHPINQFAIELDNKSCFRRLLICS